jgi:hypothetical protein
MLIDSRDPETRKALNLDALPPYGVKPRPEGGRAVYVVWDFRTDTAASGVFPDRSDAFRWMDKLNAVVKAGLKVFDMDDCTWYAALTVEDAKRQYAADMGEDSWDDFPEDYPRELTNEEMARLKYVADPYDKPDETEPFRDALAHMLAEGKEFPRFFATTEY